MTQKLKRILIGVALLILLAVLYGWWRWPSLVNASFPQLEGEIQLAGLDGPVEVYRDSMGVPHIFASTEHDLFMVQGYVHAQDRFWQMDFNRHVSTGRVSELMGKITLDQDKFLRTLGWERVALQELEELDQETLGIFNYYSSGVNAYLEEHAGTEISLEYLFLNLLNRGYEPEPWKPVHTLSWAKAMAWDLRGNMDTELDRAKLLSKLSTDQLDDIYPQYPDYNPAIVENWVGSANTQESKNMLAYPFSPAYDQILDQFASLDSMLEGGSDSGIGSNSWVVSGDLTNSGYPLLANDMHLTANIPHIWYEVGLHCQPKTDSCPWDVAGVSFAGVPGVVVGHNDRIAWGYTNLGPDVMDLYIEKINPDNPDQYEYLGEWVDMDIYVDTIQLGSGDKTEELIVRSTIHGPIITDVYGLSEFADEAGIDLPENYAIALRWTALEVNFTARAILNIDRAQNWDDFQAAASDFTVPAQNLIYADVDGNIGYQMPGNVPIRDGGNDGNLPVPGWTGEYEWLGYIPFEELPSLYNPEKGYIATANNQVIGDEYPFHINDFWAYGFRSNRISELIKNSPDLIDIPYFQEIQGDNKNQSAEFVLPYLFRLSIEDQHLLERRDFLAEWNLQNHMDSPQAPLYEAFWKHLLLLTFVDDLPEEFEFSGSGRWSVATIELLKDANNAWWDDITTSDQKEARDDVILQSFTLAVEDIEERLGSNEAEWKWGELHQVSFNHEVMSNFPVIKNFFNQGPFPSSGGNAMINKTNWSVYNEDYMVSGGTPSQRLIVDLSDFSTALLIHPTGQSGHAGHENYIDMVDMWANIEYNPLLWSLAQVKESATNKLTFLP
ncbi:MAG: penicillin acylase family protein [Chloroflexi bacterium]|jgi:penicillin G amidase|nr:penicillin acylase family protein [Chloroflexota bacterium]MBT3671114.1 penicillin acylase family protein [Chloroflexota bacterium]MBT4003143.1 penicillin acylase family protein [Chloroflexota bacterium]MBT4304427.1 penicillin acylase family protein [Chloroflexota bacterium]MBT4534446.1 penicillin acylase family protein [Chloroflexota bacterium]